MIARADYNNGNLEQYRTPLRDINMEEFDGELLRRVRIDSLSPNIGAMDSHCVEWWASQLRDGLKPSELPRPIVYEVDGVRKVVFGETIIRALMDTPFNRKTVDVEYHTRGNTAPEVYDSHANDIRSRQEMLAEAGVFLVGDVDVI